MKTPEEKAMEDQRFQEDMWNFLAIQPLAKKLGERDPRAMQQIAMARGIAGDMLVERAATLMLKWKAEGHPECTCKDGTPRTLGGMFLRYAWKQGWVKRDGKRVKKKS